MDLHVWPYPKPRVPQQHCRRDLILECAGNPSATFARDHFDRLARVFRTVADVKRVIRPIVVKTVKWQVIADPLCDAPHVFISDEEVDCCAASRANWLAVFVNFMGRMLINPWRDTTGDLSRKSVRAKAISDFDLAKILDDRVDDADRQVVKRRKCLGGLGQISYAKPLLSVTTFD